MLILIYYQVKYQKDGYMIVYKATNKINGKIYIGKTIRKLSHAKARHFNRAKLGFNTYFYNAIRKYGFDCFEWEVVYSGISDIDICNKEIDLIKEYNAKNQLLGYNMTDGGDGSAGIITKESTKKLRSINSLGIKNNCYGLHGINHPAYGNKHSQEVRSKISKTFKDKPKTEEHKLKLSKAKLALSNYSYELRVRACELRIQGLTYQKIADELNISSSAVAYKIITNFKKHYATVQTTSE